MGFINPIAKDIPLASERYMFLFPKDGLSACERRSFETRNIYVSEMSGESGEVRGE